VTNQPELAGASLSIEGRVATLTLQRDDVRNELTGTGLHAEIVKATHWLNQAEEVSVLILTGSGKSFSAGGNVKDMQSRSGSFGGDVYDVQAHYRKGIQRMALAMDQLEIPSIAAINGVAIGAGFDLACMCDLRLSAESALMGETFVNLGIIPGDGGAWFLPRLVGYQRAAELSFTGRLIGAQEAQTLGIVLETHAADRLMPRARELAAEIAGKPPRALRLAKRLLKAGQRMELHDVLDMSAVLQGICHNSEDHIEAVSAFLDKRPAKLTGR
jgi:enoyl-CoA hydratase/carnithine racemase